MAELRLRISVPLCPVDTVGDLETDWKGQIRHLSPAERRVWLQNYIVKSLQKQIFLSMDYGVPAEPSGPPTCKSCGLVNEYAESNPNYVCYECRT